ncbi:MAG: hypothetical protein JW987_02970 [Anaerolineaceae bacterium]|nr:hypothetical protein [Anaerolineaceae bacterium]
MSASSNPNNPAGVKQWIIVSIAMFPLLLIEAVLSTFFIMVMLNGYPSLPDLMVAFYLTGALFLVIGSSLAVGWLAKKLSGALAAPLWLGGILVGGGFITIMPFALLVLTFGLLAVFGLL